MAAVLALLLVLYVHAAVAQREGDLRLMEGTRCGEGRVEVYHNDQWGTVCDDRFDLNEARVICRQLGYRGARAVRHRAHFGRGTGKVQFPVVNFQLKFCYSYFLCNSKVIF